MWERRAHMLATFTKIMSSKVKYKWTKIEKNALDETKRIVARDTLPDYPNFSEEFKIHTNASKLQLGVVIRQNGKPVALYSR